MVSGNDLFATTRWSVVLSSAEKGDVNSPAQAALGELCRTYWRPIVAFISHRGYQAADAQDLAQDFFVRILEGDFLDHADPLKGRFRAFLCTSLQNFLRDQHTRAQAKKRGGDRLFVSLDASPAGLPSHLSFSAAALESWPAEKIFDLRWAATVVERALHRLREEFERRGRGAVFSAIEEFLASELDGAHLANVANMLTVSEGSAKTILHRARARFRTILRAEIAETVADTADLDAEVRYLCAVLSVGVG